MFSPILVENFPKKMNPFQYTYEGTMLKELWIRMLFSGGLFLVCNFHIIGFPDNDVYEKCFQIINLDNFLFLRRTKFYEATGGVWCRTDARYETTLVWIIYGKWMMFGWFIGNC